MTFPNVYWAGQQKPFYKANDLQEYEQVNDGVKCVFNMAEPMLTVYQGEGQQPDQVVVTFPGGNYEPLAIYLEDHGLAKQLGNYDIIIAVLKYKLLNPETSDLPHLVPLADAARPSRYCVSIIVSRTSQWWQ